MPVLTREGDVFVLNLGDGENRLNPQWIAEVTAAIDEAASSGTSCALVASATGKIWSNGIDLEWLSQNPIDVDGFVGDINEMLAKVLEFPGITVAALQGHCFAGGAMLSMAFDQRVMRADRGFWCLPEVDINIPFVPGMSDLLSARLSPRVAHEAMTTGQRYGGADAARLGIVDEAVAEDEVFACAMERAQKYSTKDPATLRTIKQRLYGPVLTALRDRSNNSINLG